MPAVLAESSRPLQSPAPPSNTPVVRLLDEETIGKIAAGEVVERPVSAVKELLENALDAGATRIRVAVREGGIGLIEIADNGCGIAEDELSVAIRRHATSKLRAFTDLDSLRTLGFRGEALPSIAAVSDLTIRSRTADGDHGHAIRVAFGKVTEPEAVAASAGTVVTVRDLFANVPARKKFLRQTGTESGYILRAVAAYAGAYPEVAIEFVADERRAFATTGSGDPITAALEVWGAEVGNAALRLEPLDEISAVPGVTVTGWVGAPSVTRSHRQGIVLFVNGRWVQNRALSFALEEAYHSLLMVGRHPVACVHVHLDPAAVDVNVHPTKAEVKFEDERAACRALSRATHAALARGPRAEMPGIRFQHVPGGAEPGEATLSPVVHVQSPMGNAPVAFPSPTPSAGMETANVGWGAPQLQPKPSVTTAAAEVEELQPTHRSGVPVLRVLGQVGGNYIVAEGPDGMYLIDQHAAHERVMYEKILGQLAGREMARQPLLDPLVVELTPEEMGAWEKSRAELDAIGFEIDMFAAQAVLVRTVPALVQRVDIAERLRLILQELAEGGTGASWMDAVAISTACHTSIRAGQVLSIPEMRELVAQLEQTVQPRACGHGRPTMLHLSQGDLEKQFERR